MRCFLGSFALFALIGCRPAEPTDPIVEDPDDPAPQLEPPGAAFVRFAIGDGVPDLFDVPFPSELYRDDDGRIAIGTLPNPEDGQPVFDAIRQLIAQRDGFCATCNVTFAIEGGLAVETLATLDDAKPDLDAAVILVDVDPTSPEHGRMFPLRSQWDPARGWLSVRPVRGIALAGGRRYAAVVTASARGGDDLPIGPAPDFAAVRDGDVDDDPRLRAAFDILAPTLLQLEALGLPPERIVGLAAFSTEDPTADLRAIRSTVRAADRPAATVDAIWSGDALDELLGIPSEERPGIDIPPLAGTEGTQAVPHATTAIVVTGRFSAPRFVTGTGSEVGVPTRAGGSPVAEAMDEVPFVLIVPRDADLARLPVVVSHHGFNASRTTGFAIGDTAGRAGFAVLAIDAYQHGQRAASARDDLFAMRGTVPGADGFAETSTLDVSARTFGLTGVDPDLTLYPGYALGAFEQFAADAMAAIRFAAEGDLAAIRAADPALADLAFDPNRIAYVGNSMGAVVGTAVVVAEPDVRAAVLNVMPGSIVETLVESGEFRPLTEGILLPQVGVTEPFDEIDRMMIFDPTVDLYRWVLEPVDPLALAPYLVHARVTAGTPDLLVQLAGHDEVAAPTASESVVAAARIPGEGAFAFADVQPFGGGSIGAIRWADAMHGMLEVAAQSSSFQAPLEPPLAKRDASLRIENPITAVHAQIEGFLRTFSEEGHGAIVP